MNGTRKLLCIFYRSQRQQPRHYSQCTRINHQLFILLTNTFIKHFDFCVFPVFLHMNVLS